MSAVIARLFLGTSFLKYFYPFAKWFYNCFFFCLVFSETNPVQTLNNVDLILVFLLLSFKTAVTTKKNCHFIRYYSEAV